MTIGDQELATSLAARAGSMLCDLRELRRHLSGRQLGRVGDLASNELIVGSIRSVRPDDAILSEESVDDPSRLTAARVWIVDPLDGTREYGLEGRSDWAVHVALWERDGQGGSPGLTAATVALPASGGLFSAGAASEAVVAPRDSIVRVVVSDSRPPAWLEDLGRQLPIDVTPLGSAGAKAMAVLQGHADAYVHSGGQYEWDSAAPVAVVQAAGLHASRLDGAALRYNEPSPYLPDLLICRKDLATTLLEALASIGAG